MVSIALRLLGITIILNLAPIAEAEVIKLRADVWCPFNCDPKSDKPGYMVEIAKAALEGKGDTIEYQTLNWARAISDARDGKYQGIVGAAESDAPDFSYPAKPLGRSNNCFYVRSDNAWVYKGVDSLKDISVAVIKDYTYGEPLDAYIKQNEKNGKKIDVVSGDNPLELNLKKLDAGRVVSYIEDESVYKNYLLKKGLQPKVKNAGCLDGNSISIAFSPKYPRGKELAKKLSDHVESMRKDGSLKKLLDTYGINDWEK